MFGLLLPGDSSLLPFLYSRKFSESLSLPSWFPPPPKNRRWVLRCIAARGWRLNSSKHDFLKLIIIFWITVGLHIEWIIISKWRWIFRNQSEPPGRIWLNRTTSARSRFKNSQPPHWSALINSRIHLQQSSCLKFSKKSTRIDQNRPESYGESWPAWEGGW